VQLDDINIFDSKPPTPEEILAAGPGATATPIDPYERFQQERSQLSLDPVMRNLQKVGRGIGSLFAVETPLDYALSGLAAAKPVVAAGKGLVTLAHGTTKDAAKQIEKEGAITPKLGSYVEDMYIKRGDYKDVDPFDYPPQASYFSTADNPASSISAMEAQIGYKLGKNIDEPISLKEIEDHGAIVLSDANPKYVFKMDEDDFMPYDLLGNRQSIDAPMGFEANDIVSFLPQEPKKILQGKQLVNFVKKNRGEDRGIAAIAKQAEPKDMVFVHNTSEEAIKSFDNMGGIPSPSIAVTKADQPFTGFGKIQLIGRPEKFDPLVDPRNKIYSSDAYTPRAPKKIRLAKPDAVEQLAKDYAGMEIQHLNTDHILKKGQDALRKLQKNNLFNPENRIDELDRFLDSGLAKTKFYQEIGRDPADLKDKPFPQIKFNKWVNEQKDKYLSQDGVFTYFDEFDETTRTIPYTLDNVVENMVQERQRGGEGDLGFFGDNRLMALTSESFKDLPRVKAQKDRLVEKAIGSTGAVEDDIMQSIIKNLPDEDLVKAQQMNYPNIKDVRLLAENEASYIATQLTEAIGQNLEYGMDLPKAIKTAYTENEDLLELPKMMPGALFDDIEQALIKNTTRPVEYFEAKPTRAVGFDEFAGAIVPENTSKEVIDILEKRGLKVVKQKADDVYDYGKGKIRQQFGEQFFSMAPIAAGASATAMMEEEDRGIGSL